MATAYNSTVNLYKKVPLVKNGTEVLFATGGAALGALGAPAATFSQYYYVRETAGVVQVDSPIGPIEDCNYIAFQNASHGGKWHFGFIDKVAYVNDNNTQIEFTVDPFPTYMNDCHQFTDYYVVRNTPKGGDARGKNLQKDYLPESVKTRYVPLSGATEWTCTKRVMYYVSKSPGPSAEKIAGVGNLFVGPVDSSVVEDVQQNGGTIIGGYTMPSTWNAPEHQPVRLQGSLNGTPFSGLAGYLPKVQSGVYHKVALITSNGSKNYDLEQFTNPASIEFQIIGLMIPSPAVYVYPRNYRGIDHNTSEGVMIKCPAIPITANPVYTNSQNFSDLVSGMMTIGAGAVGGFMKGGPVGALVGAGLAAGGVAINAAKNYGMTELQAPVLHGSGEAIFDGSNKMFAQLFLVSPTTDDLDRIDQYLRYYGYAVNAQSTADAFGGGVPNLDDKAYLQTGSDLFAGPHCDELNARCMAGIKIRKTLS